MKVIILRIAVLLISCRDGPGETIGHGPENHAERISARRNRFEDNAKATVSVSSRFAHGSGVFINREGDILTSLHLVPEGADPMFVKWSIADRTRSFSAESLFWDKHLDLLLLRSSITPERYVRFAGAPASPAMDGVYLLERKLGNGITKFYGRYLGDGLPYNNAMDTVSNYLLPASRFSSGAGIFRSEDDAFIGINRLVVDESSAPAPISGATVEQIKTFLRCHRINFEEVE